MTQAETQNTQWHILVVLTKLWKTTISFLISVYPSVRLSVCPSVRMSVRPSAWNNSAPSGWIFMNFDVSIFWKFVKEIQPLWISHKNNRYLTWRSVYVLITPRSVLLRMINVSENIVEKIKTLLGSVTFFRKWYRYEIMWKNTIERGRPHIKIWCICIIWWILRATNTHS
jgi:hypothetical protein